MNQTKTSNYLKDLREDNDLTLADLAQILGTTYQYYQKNEKANRHSNCRVICDMAIFYVIKKDSKELLSVLYDKYHYHSKKYGELVKEYQKKSAGFQRKI